MNEKGLHRKGMDPILTQSTAPIRSSKLLTHDSKITNNLDTSQPLSHPHILLADRTIKIHSLTILLGPTQDSPFYPFQNRLSIAQVPLLADGPKVRHLGCCLYDSRAYQIVLAILIGFQQLDLRVLVILFAWLLQFFKQNRMLVSPLAFQNILLARKWMQSYGMKKLEGGLNYLWHLNDHLIRIC